MKTIKLVFFSLLFCTTLFAQFSVDQKVELDKKIYKTELFLKKILFKDLESMLSTDRFLLTVKLKVDEKRIFNEVGGLDDKWDRVKKMELPGLFLDSGSQESLKEVQKITEENILSNIQKFQVNVTVTHENIDLTQVEELTKSIVSSNYSLGKEMNLEVQVEYKAPLNLAKITSMDKVKDAIPFFIGLLLFGVLCLVGLYFIAKSFNQSIANLNEVIAKKDIGGSIKLKHDGKSEDSSKKKAVTNSSNTVEIVDKYHEIVDKIRATVDVNYETLSQLISFSFHLEHYEKIVVLMEVLPQDKREQVYASLPTQTVQKFKDFLVFNGDDLYDDGVKLVEAAKHIIKMLSLSAINSENFYSYYLKEISSSLSARDIGTVINELSINELMYFIEFVDKPSLGFAMASSNFDSMKLTADYRALEQTEIKLCVDKISKLLMKSANLKAEDPRLSILPFLSEEMEKVVINKFNLDPDSSFTNLVKNNHRKVQSFLADQEYESIMNTLCLFSENLRDEFIVEMPDILAERLLGETYKLSKESLVMKSHLINFLNVKSPLLEEAA